MRFEDGMVILAFIVVSSVPGPLLMFIKRRNKEFHTPNSYFLGNRDLPPIATAISLFMSFSPLVLITDYPVEMYNRGATPFLRCIGQSIGIIIAAALFVPMLFRLKVATTYEYAEKRFATKALRYTSSTIAIIISIVNNALVTYSLCLSVVVVSPLPVWAAAILISVKATFSAGAGGIQAVVWTNVVHFATMFACLSAVVAISFKNFDRGLSEAISLSTEGGRLNFLGQSMSIHDDFTIWTAIFPAMFHYVGLLFSQTALQRYTSFRSMGRCVGAVLSVVPQTIALHCLLLFLAISMYASYTILGCDPFGLGRRYSSGLSSHFVKDFLEDKYPGIVGAWMVTLLASTLSTLSAGVNATVGLIWHDFIGDYLERRDLKEKRLQTFLKLVTIFIGCLTLALALLMWRMPPHYVKLIGKFSLIVSSGFYLLHLAGALIPFVNRPGVISGIVLSISLTVALTTCQFYYGFAEKPVRLPVPRENCQAILANLSLSMTTPGCNQSSTALFTATTMPSAVIGDKSFTTKLPIDQGTMARSVDQATKSTMTSSTTTTTTTKPTTRTKTPTKTTSKTSTTKSAKPTTTRSSSTTSRTSSSSTTTTYFSTTTTAASSTVSSTSSNGQAAGEISPTTTLSNVKDVTEESEDYFDKPDNRLISPSNNTTDSIIIAISSVPVEEKPVAGDQPPSTTLKESPSSSITTTTTTESTQTKSEISSSTSSSGPGSQSPVTNSQGSDDGEPNVTVKDSNGATTTPSESQQQRIRREMPTPVNGDGWHDDDDTSSTTTPIALVPLSTPSVNQSTNGTRQGAPPMKHRGAHLPFWLQYILSISFFFYPIFTIVFGFILAMLISLCAGGLKGAKVVGAETLTVSNCFADPAARPTVPISGDAEMWLLASENAGAKSQVASTSAGYGEASTATTMTSKNRRVYNNASEYARAIDPATPAQLLAEDGGSNSGKSNRYGSSNNILTSMQQTPAVSVYGTVGRNTSNSTSNTTQQNVRFVNTSAHQNAAYQPLPLVQQSKKTSEYFTGDDELYTNLPAHTSGYDTIGRNGGSTFQRTGAQ